MKRRSECGDKHSHAQNELEHKIHYDVNGFFVNDAAIYVN